MPKYKSGREWTPRQSRLHRQKPETAEPDLYEENSILELISMGAPLTDTLNKLCAAVDFQIGNVVSVIMPAESPKGDLAVIARSAQVHGLHVFWSGNIQLWDKIPCGYFEMYSSNTRAPNPFELHLIQRATHLAALAMQRHNSEKKFETLSAAWKHAPRSRSQDEPELI